MKLISFDKQMQIPIGMLHPDSTIIFRKENIYGMVMLNNKVYTAITRKQFLLKDDEKLQPLVAWLIAEDWEVFTIDESIPNTLLAISSSPVNMESIFIGDVKSQNVFVCRHNDDDNIQILGIISYQSNSATWVVIEFDDDANQGQPSKNRVDFVAEDSKGGLIKQLHDNKYLLVIEAELIVK